MSRRNQARPRSTFLIDRRSVFRAHRSLFSLGLLGGVSSPPIPRSSDSVTALRVRREHGDRCRGTAGRQRLALGGQVGRLGPITTAKKSTTTATEAAQDAEHEAEAR